MVWVQIVCIRNDSSTKLTVSREGLTHEILMKTSYLHPVLTLRDTHENQLSPSRPNSSHSSNVQDTCIISRGA